MKPLYWTRILATPDAAETPDGKTAIWKEIDELPLESFNDFSELFSRQPPIKKPPAKKVEEKERVEAVKLLDNKRSQNVGILAQSLRIDIHEIENAIYTFDTSVVNLESLQQIYEAVSEKFIFYFISIMIRLILLLIRSFIKLPIFFLLCLKTMTPQYVLPRVGLSMTLL